MLSSWYRNHYVSLRHYSSAGGDGEEGGEEVEHDEDDSDLEGLLPAKIHQHAIASVSIPDNFPEVPVLAISRNPIFPRFVKMLEVRLS